MNDTLDVDRFDRTTVAEEICRSLRCQHGGCYGAGEKNNRHTTSNHRHHTIESRDPDKPEPDRQTIAPHLLLTPTPSAHKTQFLDSRKMWINTANCGIDRRTSAGERPWALQLSQLVQKNCCCCCCYSLGLQRRQIGSVVVVDENRLVTYSIKGTYDLGIFPVHSHTFGRAIWTWRPRCRHHCQLFAIDYNWRCIFLSANKILNIKYTMYSSTIYCD